MNINYLILLLHALHTNLIQFLFYLSLVMFGAFLNHTFSFLYFNPIWKETFLLTCIVFVRHFLGKKRWQSRARAQAWDRAMREQAPLGNPGTTAQGQPMAAPIWAGISQQERGKSTWPLRDQTNWWNDIKKVKKLKIIYWDSMMHWL